MDSKQRRSEIARRIEAAGKPLSASVLAAGLGVSRQVIVGDVALLRAEGRDIISTARGYLDNAAAGRGRYTAKLASCHDKARTRDELYAIVDMGGQVLDVIVEHAVYGEITGRLDISCRRDADEFLAQVESGEARLLSELTDGVHLHTISCANSEAFLKIRRAMQESGFLYPDA